MSRGFFAVNIAYISISQHPIRFLQCGSTKLNGGTNTNPIYAAKRMWSIFAKLIQKSSLSTISSILKSNPSQLLLHQQRRKALLHPPSPKQKDYLKRRRISSNILRMILVCVKLRCKKSLTKRATLMTMKQSVRQPHRPQNLAILAYKISRTPTNCKAK